jgi:parallel beta-helix repeat protein
MMCAGTQAWAADCGDTAGAGGARVACTCGDTVVTNTTLRADDPVVNALCFLDGLKIGVDGITLNCNGREIRGNPFEEGIFLRGRTGVTVRACKIKSFYSGIYLVESSDNVLLSNTIAPAWSYGIVLDEFSSRNLVKSNRVVSPAASGIYLGFGANGNRIITNSLDGGNVHPLSTGIEFQGGTDNTIKGNRVSGFGRCGIELVAGADGNTVIENRSSESGFGICISGSADTVSRNTTSSNRNGGLEIKGDDNIVDGNRGESNGLNGLTVSGSDSTVRGNTFNNNVDWGICVSSGNTDGGMNRGRGNGVGDVSFNCP